MTTILLIDDDPSLHQLLGKYLEQFDHHILHANDGREGVRAVFENRPDLIVLDVMMPHLDGWSVLERIREMSDVPVIMLTARDNESDKLQGFRLGSDDYVTKPFSFAELAARIDAILKRAASKSSTPQVIQSGMLIIDLLKHLVILNGEHIRVTPTEFKLLEVMMREPNRVFTNEQLVERVWGEEYAEEIGYIRRYIWHLRQKIEPDPDDPTFIVNERGIGYKFQPQ